MQCLSSFYNTSLFAPKASSEDLEGNDLSVTSESLFTRMVPAKVSDVLRVIIPTFFAANMVWVITSEEHTDLYGSRTASQIASQTLYATLAAGLGCVIGTIGNKVYHQCITKKEATLNNNGFLALPSVATGVVAWDVVVGHVKSTIGSAVGAGFAESSAQVITQHITRILAEYFSPTRRGLIPQNMKRFVSGSLATIILNAPSGAIWKLLYDACNKERFTTAETALIISSVVALYQSVGITVDYHVQAWLDKFFKSSSAFPDATTTLISGQVLTEQQSREESPA